MMRGNVGGVAATWWWGVKARAWRKRVEAGALVRIKWVAVSLAR